MQIFTTNVVYFLTGVVFSLLASLIFPMGAWDRLKFIGMSSVLWYGINSMVGILILFIFGAILTIFGDFGVLLSNSIVGTLLFLIIVQKITKESMFNQDKFLIFLISILPTLVSLIVSPYFSLEFSDWGRISNEGYMNILISSAAWQIAMLTFLYSSHKRVSIQ